MWCKDDELDGGEIEFSNLWRPFTVSSNTKSSGSNSFIALDLLDKDHVQQELGKRRLTIVVQSLVNLLPKEISRDDCCMNDDEFLFDRDKFHELKDRNQEEWERRMGRLEYGRRNRLRCECKTCQILYQNTRHGYRYLRLGG